MAPAGGEHMPNGRPWRSLTHASCGAFLLISFVSLFIIHIYMFRRYVFIPRTTGETEVWFVNLTRFMETYSGAPEVIHFPFPGTSSYVLVNCDCFSISIFLSPCHQLTKLINVFISTWRGANDMRLRTVFLSIWFYSSVMQPALAQDHWIMHDDGWWGWKIHQ